MAEHLHGFQPGQCGVAAAVPGTPPRAACFAAKPQAWLLKPPHGRVEGESPCVNQALKVICFPHNCLPVTCFRAGDSILHNSSLWEKEAQGKGAPEEGQSLIPLPRQPGTASTKGRGGRVGLTLREAPTTTASAS